MRPILTLYFQGIFFFQHIQAQGKSQGSLMNKNFVSFNGISDINKSHVLDMMPNYVGHKCDRECKVGQIPWVCKYKFVVESYRTLSKACFGCPLNASDCYKPHCVAADGIAREITTLNRQMPGPNIVVCKGDKVEVDVYNHMVSEVFTIHFHGEHMHDHQYMDGVPFITQCPIQPGTRFVYKFRSYVAGTHFYHSHMQFQRSDGAMGAMVVRQPLVNEPHAELYDLDLTEHIIVVQEWFNVSSHEAYINHHWEQGSQSAQNMLVNGMGRFVRFGKDKNIATPNAIFKVTGGKKYRFRVINSGFMLCPIQIYIEGHMLKIIASDGSPVKPVTVKSFVTFAGERYDFVLDANQKPDSYLFHFMGLLDCGDNKIHATARLHYKSSPEKLLRLTPKYQTDEIGPSLNYINYAPPTMEQHNKKQYLPITHAMHAIPRSKVCNNKVQNVQDSSPCSDPSKKHALKSVADRQVFLGIDLNEPDNVHFHNKYLYSYEKLLGGNQLRSPQLNNVTNEFPPSPFLSQESDIDPKLICTHENIKKMDCGKGNTFCECMYVLEVDLNSTVELVLIDEGKAFDISHPLHLHGHSFYVVAMERHAKEPDKLGPDPTDGNEIDRLQVIEMDRQGKIKRNLKDPPMKDTVSVPDGGFTVIRFWANNPGYWFLHCHMAWHEHLGMGITIKVGTVKDFPPVPKGFPSCGDFT